MKPINSTKIISFIGYSGSGKTTFIEKLIPILKKRGLRTGLIKHDAHEFEIDKPGKDSFRYRRAGADVVGIFSKSQAAVYGNNELLLPGGAEDLKNADTDRIHDIDGSDYIQKTGIAVSEMLAMMPENLDIIIIEGSRDSSIPKIGIYRTETGKGLSVDPEKLVAVITDDPAAEHISLFGLEDVEAVADFITSEEPYISRSAANDDSDNSDYPTGISAQQGLEILNSVPIERQK